MNIIVAVTNEKFIAESFFTQYYGSGKLAKIDSTTEEPRDGEIVFAEWKTIVNGEETVNYIKENKIPNNGTSVIYVPYQGLAYIIARERALNRVENKFIIASMKESYQTPVIANELYNILLDTRLKIGFSIFERLFDKMDHNALMDEEFDVVIESIKEGKIMLLGDSISPYLDSILTD
jgi:hypothetical protein